jgi:hypothetical protein
MMPSMQQSLMDWAEDRATQRCDPSADPGAKTGAWAGRVPALLPSSPLRDWHQSDKPSRHDAATSAAGCSSQLTKVKRLDFQFPVNQNMPRS